MTEFLYHALGICGEHWHPNLINLSLITMMGIILIKNMKNRLVKK
tara:strand:+ start:81 stop:215 length:135 start_codon:yes stop_codon:yes gene_type:complete